MKFSGIVPNNIIYHLKRFEQNRYCSFWEMVKKPAKNTVFLTWIIQKNFFRKKGFVTFLRVSISNFWPKISKILRAVLCNFCVIDRQTDRLLLITFPGLTSTEVENGWSYRTQSDWSRGSKNQKNLMAGSMRTFVKVGQTDGRRWLHRTRGGSNKRK